MNSPHKHLSLTYSLADQSFARTKSLGILNFSVQLFRALARRPECAAMTVLANETLRQELCLPLSVRLEWHNRAADGGLGRIVWDQWGVNRAAQRAGNEWLLLPKGFASCFSRGSTRIAAFVHDLMQVHYDRHHPKAVGGLEAHYFRAALRASLRRAEIIFTPTECVKREVEAMALQNHWPVPRVVCCGEGFDPAPAAVAGRREGIVVLSSRHPHKLTKLTVDFMTRWQRQTGFTEPVHWVGGLPSDVELPGFANWQAHVRMPEADFRKRLGGARAVVFASEYEGFGRPPVEAILAGACPVYSDLPVTREVMAGCGYAFDNQRPEGFSAALDKALAATPWQVDMWAGLLRRRHDWDATARKVCAVLSDRRR